MPNQYLDTELPAAPAAPDAAPVKANPYLDTELDPNGERMRMRATVYTAGEVAPEVAVRARKIAERTGMAPDVVERNLPAAERQARVEDVSQYTDAAPTLRAAYGDPYFAKLAGSEPGPMAAVEKAVRSYMDPQSERDKGLKGGKVVVTPSQFSERVRQVKESNPALDWATATRVASEGVIFDNSPGGVTESQRPEVNALNLLSGAISSIYEQGKQASANMSLIAGDVAGIDNKDRVRKLLAESEHRTYLNVPEPSGYAAQQLYSGAVQGAAQAPMLLLSGGSSAPVLASFFMSSGAQGYGTTRLRGGTGAESALSGVLQGGLEVATELLPMQFAVAGFGKMGFGEFLSGFLAREMGGEWINTLASNAVDTAIANPNKSWSDYLAEQPKALLDTTLQVLGTAGTLGVLSKGLAVTATRAQARQFEIDKANERAGMLGELFNIAAGTKVRGLDANTFGDFVQKVADSTGSDLAQVHVDASILADALKQSGVEMDAFAQMSPEAAKALPEALQSGGSVAIPVGDLVGRMGDSGIEKLLLPHLRATEDGLSLEEAKVEQATAQEFLAQESSRVMQQAADFQATEQSAEAVRGNMFAQLQATGRFSADVNKAYSTLVGSFYTVLGNNLGVTPEQAYAQFPLRVQAVAQEGENLTQPADAAEAEVLRGIVTDTTLTELQAALTDFAETPQVEVAPEDLTRAQAMIKPVLALAAQEKPAFDAQVQEIANSVGIEARIPGLKKMPRAAAKLVTELDFDVSRMRDLLRATVVVDSVADVQKALDAIAAKYEIVRVKNRFDNPTESGYRDVPINVRLPSGLEAEIQVNIPAMILAKSHGHKLYAMSRGAPAGEVKSKLEELQTRVYGEAFSAAQNAMSAASAREALLRKTSGGKGLPLSAKTTEPSASLNTGTPSTSNTTAPSGTLNIGTSFDKPIIAAATLSDFTPEALPELLSKGDWAVLTAADPGATKQSDAANAAAMEQLRQDLTDLGVSYTEAVGKYGDVQPSFIITGIPERVAQALGNKYGQESILTRKGLIYQDGSITPATGIDVFDTPPEDFYTEVPDTGAYFSVQLDFDQRIQPAGAEAFAQSLSARVPTAAGAVNNINDIALSNLAALQMAPTLLAKIATRLGGAASLLTRRLKDPDALLDAYIDQMTDNLVWLHDQVPPEIRERSKLWYDGARALVDRVVAKYNGAYTAPQVSGVYAVMSPQMDWFQNVTLGDRIIDVWSAKQDFMWTPEMGAAIRNTAAAGSPEVLQAIEGKTLGQLERDDHAAYWIAAYDLAYNPRDFHVVTPEGDFADLSRNVDGRPMKASWANGFGPIAKAVSILRDGSPQNISDMLGKKHKVRNFYNNIFAPNAKQGFVTSDTHAVAAALLLPLSGASPEVMDNFGAAGANAATGIFGSYPVYVEAYTRAVERVNARDGTVLLPREMQSITWEALRGLFTPAFKKKYNSKRDSSTRDAFDAIWKDYHAKRRSLDDARSAILQLAGGIVPPEWHRPTDGGAAPRWSSSYAGELLAQSGPGGTTDSGAAGLTTGGTAAATSGVEDTATQVEQRRMRQATDLAILQSKPQESDALAQTAAGEKPGQVAVTGVHFSTKPGLNHVNGRYYGTGLKGAEKDRVRASADTRLAARSYFYVDEGKGVRPEAGVGGNAHEAQLTNLYDINSDPLKLIAGGDINATESNILNAGFDGYYRRDAFNQQGAAVVIGPASYAIPVAPIANPTTKAPPLPSAPAVYKRGLMSSELNKIDINAIKVVAPSAQIKAGAFTVLESEQAAAAAVAAMQGIDLPMAPAYAQGEGARGLFSPSTLTITLLENADLTTFLHETGHFMLEAMASVANRVDAPANMREDMTTVLNWFGVKDMQTWMALDTNGKRPYHEKFAESFEQYLFEGKAPSVELQSVFRRFRSWLQNVYRSLTDFMRSHNTQLSDEVRQVFDRMLATEDAIKNAEDAAGMFSDPDATQAAIEKLTARSLRDLKWTINARSKAIKALQHQAAQLRAAVKAEVTAEVDDMPVFRARDALAALKTDEQHGVDTIPQEEAIAEANGFTGVDHMLAAVLAAGGKAATIEAMTDNRMLERYGDLIDQRAIEKAANEEVHNEARARSLATELAAQTEALNAREDTGKTNAAGARMTVNILMKAAKHFASNLIGRTTVRELPSRNRQHLAAERRAGKAWQKATAAGKTDEAIRAKKDQVLNNAAAREAIAAQDEVTKTIDYFKKFDKDTVRSKLPQDYLDQIDRLLESIDLRKSTTNRDIDRRQSLSEWVAAQHELGLDPVLPDYLLNGMRQVSYKELTVDEVRGLKDTIKNIEHLGRLKGKLLKAKDQREFDVIADEIAASIRENGGKELPVQLEPDGKVSQFFKGAWADHRKLNSLVHQMDGGKDNGPFYRALIRSMNDSGAQEGVMLEEATMALADIFKPVEALPGGLSGGNVFIPEIKNTLSRSGRLAIALNWGNTQNRQRITGGDGWTDAQAMAVIKTLSRTELEFVNKVWEHIDSYWPAIKAKQLRVSGVVEDKVEAEPFEVEIDTPNGKQTVQMRGGYYPIKYDSDRSIRAEKNEAVEKALDIMRGAFMRPTTRRGHTKARVDEVIGRPLRKDLSALTQHISQAVHDLAWHEWFIDANRLMNDSRIQSAIRDHYGPQTARAMRDGINAIAVGDAVHQGQIDQLLLRMRSAVTRSIMGFSMTTALLQPFGLTQSMARIGVVPVLKGAARWAGDAMHMENTVGWINEKSDFMRLRNKTFNRELREINQRLHGKSTFARIADASLFMAMQKMQMVADVPTWVGMYEKALAGGVSEDTAVALADEAVLASQGGGTIKDLSAVQRDMPFMTQFYSYFNTTMNLVAEKTGRTDFKNPRAVAGWLGDMALLTVIPSILPAMITFLLKGGGGGDDPPEKWAKRMLDWYASYMFGMFVGLRELPTLWSPFSYAGPPAAKLINDGRRLVQQAEQGEIDDKAVLAVIGFMGTALGLPTSQLIRSYKGWQAWDEGKAPPTALLFGPPPKE